PAYRTGGRAGSRGRLPWEPTQGREYAVTTVLEEIIAGVREDLAEREAQVPLDVLKERAQQQPGAKDAVAALRGGADAVTIIAEVTRSSPSKGALAELAGPAGLAVAYEAGGASAVSVLTERRRVGGSLKDLATVRARAAVPILRKD